MNYTQANEISCSARDPEKGKPLAKATRLRKEGNDFIIRLHNTDIIRIKPDNTYVLKNGGYLTPTTKRRINDYTPANIYQKKCVWYFNSGEEFFDGVVIDHNGNVLNPLTENTKDELKTKRTKLKKMITQYINGFCKAVENNEIGYPSGGDCWYCCMQTQDGESMGETFKSYSHILNHLEESYFVPSLLFNALKTYNNPQFIYQYTIETKSEWNCRKALRKFFKDRFEYLLPLI